VTGNYNQMYFFLPLCNFGISLCPDIYQGCDMAIKQSITEIKKASQRKMFIQIENELSGKIIVVLQRKIINDFYE